MILHDRSCNLGSSFARLNRGDLVSSQSHRTLLAVTSLEDRVVPSGLVPVGTQPQGGLTGKIVYLHAGHGYTANNLTNGAWSFQRGITHQMIEDLGNVDQMTFLADVLFRAGATVVPLRSVGHQTHEVVLDNDSPNVTFSGSWSNSTAGIYYGTAGAVPYRFASTALTETAYARYLPNIPAAGFYPVYCWTVAGGNRAPDQLYRVAHAGGITEVRVNHRRVGSGLVYLGTYYFHAGNSGYVDISNRSSSTGSLVIADMIRFGNGMGSIDRGGGISGLPREDEAGLYWVKWHVDRSQGIPDSAYRASNDDGTATVSLSPRYAQYMNRQADGSLSDRVFVSYHSNAGTGNSRGVVALYNGNNDITTRTPNMFLLANSLGREVNDDMVAQNGLFEHNWHDRGTNVTLDRSDIEFGEINNHYINDEFDATIVEVAYHDNQLDAQLMRDANVREAVARATYQGLIKYFRAVDNNTTPATQLPGPVSHLRAVTSVPGSVTLSWSPPAVNSYLGDAPTGYRIYASTNGYAFDGGTLVTGTSATLTGFDPDSPHYFKVVAVNAGGESPGSEVLAVRPAGGLKQILIVNGFDRLDRAQNPRIQYGSGFADRVRPQKSNSRDYVIQVAQAIQSARPGLRVESASNEAVISGAVNLHDYQAVFWILGEESTVNRTFDATEQAKVEAFIAAGGHFFVSGAEIGWDLDFSNNGRPFFENTLKANYIADDANTYNVTGIGIFAGLGMSFDHGPLFYDSEFPDVIGPQPGAVSAMTYSTGGSAAVTHAGTGGRGSVVTLGFPLETITSAALRTAVAERVLNFFNITPLPNILSVSVNAGQPQRSRITSITLELSTPIDTTDLTATLTRTSGGPTTVVQTGAVGGNGRILVTPPAGLTTTLTLTFDNAGTNAISPGVEHGSLADGRWQLAIPALNYVSTLSDPTLRRLFGDLSANGTVDAADFADFGVAFGLSAGPAFDFDANGMIDAIDFAHFGMRFGLTI